MTYLFKRCGSKPTEKVHSLGHQMAADRFQLFTLARSKHLTQTRLPAAKISKFSTLISNGKWSDTCLVVVNELYGNRFAEDSIGERKDGTIWPMTAA